ncbi:hypothetical protein ACP70R_000659 [Stipagrostis hirtigluma subsp. patula]
MVVIAVLRMSLFHQLGRRAQASSVITPGKITHFAYAIHGCICLNEALTVCRLASRRACMWPPTSEMMPWPCAIAAGGGGYSSPPLRPEQQLLRVLHVVEGQADRHLHHQTQAPRPAPVIHLLTE